VQALKLLPSAQVVAVAARSEESAQQFAQKHGIPKYYEGYDALLADEEVDIVYVGIIHSTRREIVEKCLNANKHTLVEKPFACSTYDAEYLVKLSRSKGLFMMEGMWTRFFPAIEQARRLVLGSPDGSEPGVIGEVVSVISDFNFNASDHEEYPTSIFYNHAVGGGASFFLAPYPISTATCFFGGASPDRVCAVGQVDHQTGVDLQVSMSLRFPPTEFVAPAVDSYNQNENTPKLPGAGVASLLFGMLSESEEETIVLGTRGRLTIHTPCHCPTRISCALKGHGRGETKENFVLDYPLPPETEEQIRTGGFFYPNSAGFAYEAAAVARCIAKGLTEAPQYTLDDTLNTMRIIEELRNQLGVKPID